jgi:cytochrome c5
MRSVLLLCIFLAGHGAWAAAPESLYRAKCAVCHDSGAGQAPRIDDRAAWRARAARGRAALHEVAIRGKPDTTMAPRGGFRELGDADLRAIVDYMLAASGNPGVPMEVSAPAARADRIVPAESGAAPLPAGDIALSQQVAVRLRGALGRAEDRIETYEGTVTVRGLGIKVNSMDGQVTLSGAVADGAHVARAAQVARGVPGVAGVVNRVIAAAMLEWD